MIVKCILRNFIPLLTKGVQEITLNETDIINIVIGRNGHGKTRILSELTELPPDNKNYQGEGYKYLHVVHHGKHYYLESFPGDKNVHSFKDAQGKEYNPNGTQSVQRDLVKSFFNITPFTNRILTGLRHNDRFTLLPENQRKEFLMEICPNDTREAMVVYDKMRQALNECNGALKNQTKRLTEEQQREQLIAGMSVSEIEAKIATLDKQISDALFIQGGLSDAKYVSPELNDKVTLLKSLTSDILGFKLTHDALSIPEIHERLESKQAIADYHKDKVNVYQAMLGELANKISGVKIEEIDIDLFEKQVNDYEQHLIQLNIELDNYNHRLKEHDLLSGLTHDDFEVIRTFPEFSRVLDTITPISDTTMTQSRYRKAEETLAELKSQLRNLQSRKENYQHTLDHFNNADNTECPDCKSTFKPGFKKEDIEKVKQDLTRTNQDIENITRRVNQGEAFCDRYRSWDQELTYLTQFLTNNNYLLLNSLVKEYNIGYVESNTLINALKHTVERIKVVRSINRTTEDLAVVRSRLRVFKDNNMEEVLASYHRLESLLGASTSSLLRLQNEIKSLYRQLDTIKSYDVKVSTLGVLKEEIEQLLIEEGRYELSRRIQELIAEFSPEKDSYITTLIRKQSFHSVMQSIEDNIATLTERKRKLKILVDNLCPKKGLIGELMLDFIKTLCGNINAIIAEIWSVPLYLKPCVSDKGVLDYKFPVINSDSGSEAADISFCSGGESEVINFAMLLVARRYHRAELPVFSDEFGGMMDEFHRRRFFSYIHRITSTRDISQLFMVSHYYSEYGMLQGANIIALNTEGLTVPSNTNKHTLIKHVKYNT